MVNQERHEGRQASTWHGRLLAEGGSLKDDFMSRRPGMAALAAKAKAGGEWCLSSF